MNANIMKTQIWYKMKYDLRGHKVHNKNFKIIFFCENFFCLMPDLFKTFQECNIMKTQFFRKMTLKVIQGHKRLLFCKNHSTTFVNGLILMKICINAKIMKTQFFIKLWPEMSLLCYVEVLYIFLLQDFLTS